MSTYQQPPQAQRRREYSTILMPHQIALMMISPSTGKIEERDARTVALAASIAELIMMGKLSDPQPFSFSGLKGMELLDPRPTGNAVLDVVLGGMQERWTRNVYRMMGGDLPRQVLAIALQDCQFFGLIKQLSEPAGFNRYGVFHVIEVDFAIGLMQHCRQVAMNPQAFPPRDVTLTALACEGGLANELFPDVGWFARGSIMRNLTSQSPVAGLVRAYKHARDSSN